MAADARPPDRRHRGQPGLRARAVRAGARAGRRGLRGRPGPAPRPRGAALDHGDGTASAEELAEVMGRVQLQASWSAGQVVVWAGGRGTTSTTNDDLADLLEAVGGPAVGWSLHPDVLLPSGARAEALAIPVRESLGWLVAVGGGQRGRGRRPERDVAGTGRPARRAPGGRRRGRPDPAHQPRGRRPGRSTSRSRWVPALVDEDELDALAAAMPGAGRRPRPGHAAGDHDAPCSARSSTPSSARPPAAWSCRRLRPTSDTAGGGGRGLHAPGSTARPSAPRPARPARWPAGSSSGRRSVTAPRRPRLVVQLEPPDAGGAWFLSVLGPGADGPAAADRGGARRRRTDPAAGRRAGPARAPAARPAPPGRHAPGPGRAEPGRGVGADDGHRRRRSRRPASTSGCRALSRRKPSPDAAAVRRARRRVASSAPTSSATCAGRCCSTTSSSPRPTSPAWPREARPLVQSRGRWVELDRVDLKQAAAALAERADDDPAHRRRDPAPRHRPRGVAARRRGRVGGDSWATDLFERAQAAPDAPVTRPEGFAGELRSYQAEALAWLGLPRRRRARRLPGPRHGPGQDADGARPPRPHDRPAARRSSSPRPPSSATGRPRRPASRPSLRVVVHHGASRADGRRAARPRSPTPTS